MKVVPSDNDAVYYYDVLSKQILDQHHSGDLAVYMKNMMAEAVKNYGSVEEALKKLGSQGESNYAFEGLDPNTDYLAFAAGLDAAGEVNTAIENDFQDQRNWLRELLLRWSLPAIITERTLRLLRPISSFRIIRPSVRRSATKDSTTMLCSRQS